MIAYVRVVMDADCLIKLTKAGLKETVCESWRVEIPELVEQETVHQAPDLPDALQIGRNISVGRVRVKQTIGGGTRGEQEALSLFRSGAYDAIATDDARFVRELRAGAVPFAVPSVIVVRLQRDGHLSLEEAERALLDLRPFVNPDQHSAAWLMLSGRE
jgi:hypothetical protein